jgi:hypothetical protein
MRRDAMALDFLSDADLEGLGVPAEEMARFRLLLKAAIRDLQRPRSGRPAPRSPGMIKHLDKVIKALEPLRQEDGAGHAAGVLLHATLSGRCNISIDELIEAAERAKNWARKFPARGAPKGTRMAALGFADFLFHLFVAARICGFRWTAFRARDADELKGTLPKLLRLLEPDLPRGSFPAAPITRLKAIDRSRQQLSGYLDDQAS